MPTLLKTEKQPPPQELSAGRALTAADGRVNLLLVDDDSRNLDVLESILNSPDYRLVRAQTAEEALLALITSDFAAIILDIRMPGMNGLELAQIIKQRKKTQHIPIIFLTAYYHEDDHVLHGYDAGAVDYLTKPCNPIILRSKVGVFVNLFRNTRALQTEMAERRRLEAEIARAIEREQRRLGQELHDGLGQQLTGISYMMYTLHSKLQKVFPSLAAESKRLEALIRQSVEQSRDLAKGFYPVDLEKLGLMAALENIPRQMKGFDTVEYCLEVEDDPAIMKLAGSTAVQLFRIAQEAAHNAIKHAKAKRVVVRVTVLGGHITLAIKDDGVGLQDTPGSVKGMGLTIMQYRARMVDGVLDVSNGVDGGVIVTCSVPTTSTREAI